MINESLQIKNFNDKIRIMNQANAKILTLNAEEARNLHIEIYTLLEKITSLTTNEPKVQEITQIKMDGGGFK